MNLFLDLIATVIFSASLACFFICCYVHYVTLYITVRIASQYKKIKMYAVATQILHARWSLYIITCTLFCYWSRALARSQEMFL